MFRYDVVLSYAGEDRNTVEDIAYLLQENNIKVFYDKFEISSSWGKDLSQYLYEIYKDKARYCIVFLSKNYLKKKWTKHELKSARARATESEDEYILPIYIDDVHVPGINKNVGHLNLSEYSSEDIVNFIIEKLGRHQDKTPLYNDLMEHLKELVEAFILIGSLDQILVFNTLASQFKTFLLNYVFDLQRELFWSSCALIDDIEEKVSARLCRTNDNTNILSENLTDVVNIYSKYKKMIQTIQLYIDSNFSNGINFFSLCENHGLFDSNSKEDLKTILHEIIEIIKPNQDTMD